MRPQRGFVGLDAIRLAAALAVASYHLLYWWWLPSNAPPPQFRAEPHDFGEIFRWGWVGVPVFFIISGFVIAFSANGKTAGRFVRSRARRLYPSAWICATITLVFYRVGTTGAVADYARSLLLSPVGPWISGVYWTLGVEVFFYSAVALVLALRLHVTSLAYALASVSSAFWLGRAADFAAGGPFKEAFASIETSWLSLIPYGCHFALGMFLWSIKEEGGEPRKWAAATLCLLTGCIALTAGGRFYVGEQGGHPWQAIEPTMLWLVAVAAILGAVFCNDRIRHAASSRLNWFRAMGLLTYPLYLVHSEIGREIAVSLAPIGPIAAAATALLAVVALAFLVMLAEERLGRRVTTPAPELP